VWKNGRELILHSLNGKERLNGGNAAVPSFSCEAF